jgi:hypothetical protein
LPPKAALYCQLPTLQAALYCLLLAMQAVMHHLLLALQALLCWADPCILTLGLRAGTQEARHSGKLLVQHTLLLLLLLLAGLPVGLLLGLLLLLLPLGGLG